MQGAGLPHNKMQIIRAENAGACYGVNRALDIAEQTLARGVEACTLGPIIHNPKVVRDLERRGLHVADSVDDVHTSTVVIRSHGVTPAVRQALEDRGIDIVDATCPFVKRAQDAAARLGREEQSVLIVGERGHPEVEALREYASLQGADVHVIASPSEIPKDLPEHVGVVVQTTQRRKNLDDVLAALGARGIKANVQDTICSATTLRQKSARQLASCVDAMVVIGGRNSSNTTRLYEICAAACPRTVHVEGADELKTDLFSGCAMVGVTAGASTPASQIGEVTARLKNLVLSP